NVTGVQTCALPIFFVDSSTTGAWKTALYMVGIDGVPSIIGAVFQAPVVEESTKTVLLVIIVLAARRYFEGPLDGLVYGALIGAGFAFTENILYLGGAWNENQFEG